MGAHSVPLTDYLGCAGRVAFDSTDPEVVQWARPGVTQGPLRAAEDEHLVLSGLVKGPVTPAWVQRIAAALKAGRYSELAQVPGELCGCLVTPRKVFLFRNIESTDALLYRRDRGAVRWSTNPTDLLDHDDQEFSRESLWRCCRGDEFFVYHQQSSVRPGEVVVVDEHRTTTVQFDSLPAMELPRRTTLPQYAELAYELLLQEARSYVGAGRVGLMLSGGLDSAAVLTAFAEAGVDVVVYHVLLNDPLADESNYARLICDRLSIPLVLLRTDYRDDFLPTGRWLPHPYLNPGMRWLEQLADRVQQDRITHLVWGRDGDLQFGPLTFGLRDVVLGDLRLREKAMLTAGLVCSHWELPQLLSSVKRSASLLDDSIPGISNPKSTDFLEPMGDIPEQRFDTVPDFDIKDLCANLMVWRPRGIVMCNPLGTRDIQRLAKRMPNAYRLLPYQGQLFSKPVLRLMLSTRLPAPVWRRTGRLWLHCVSKRYTATDPQVFLNLIGSPDSQLVQRGIVDPQRLSEVLADPHSRHRNAETLINAALTELFLRSHDKGGHAAPKLAGATATKGGEDHGPRSTG